ncbi:unnamed protein product, partial [Phaeothamnion confervicola]
MRKYLDGLCSRRELWARYSRLRVFSLGMTATSRIESFFSAFKANMDRVAGITDAVQILADLNMKWDIRSVEDRERAVKDSSVKVESQLAAHFLDVLHYTDTFSTAFIQRLTRRQINRCAYYEVTPINVEAVLAAGRTAAAAAAAVAGGASGVPAAAAAAAASGGTVSGAVAAAGIGGSAAGPSFAAGGADAADESADADPDDPNTMDDRPRIASGAIGAAFRGRIVRAFSVAPPRRPGWGANDAGRVKRSNLVTILDDGTHICSCAMPMTFGVACRHYYACRFRDGIVHVPFIFGQWHPRWLREVFARLPRGGGAGGGVVAAVASGRGAGGAVAGVASGAAAGGDAQLPSDVTTTQLCVQYDGISAATTAAFLGNDGDEEEQLGAADDMLVDPPSPGSGSGGPAGAPNEDDFGTGAVV